MACLPKSKETADFATLKKQKRLFSVVRMTGLDLHFLPRWERK